MIYRSKDSIAIICTEKIFDELLPIWKNNNDKISSIQPDGIFYRNIDENTKIYIVKFYCEWMSLLYPVINKIDEKINTYLQQKYYDNKEYAFKFIRYTGSVENTVYIANKASQDLLKEFTLEETILKGWNSKYNYWMDPEFIQEPVIEEMDEPMIDNNFVGGFHITNSYSSYDEMVNMNINNFELEGHFFVVNEGNETIVYQKFGDTYSIVFEEVNNPNPLEELLTKYFIERVFMSYEEMESLTFDRPEYEGRYFLIDEGFRKRIYSKHGNEYILEEEMTDPLYEDSNPSNEEIIEEPVIAADEEDETYADDSIMDGMPTVEEMEFEEPDFDVPDTFIENDEDIDESTIVESIPLEDDDDDTHAEVSD